MSTCDCKEPRNIHNNVCERCLLPLSKEVKLYKKTYTTENALAVSFVVLDSLFREIHDGDRIISAMRLARKSKPSDVSTEDFEYLLNEIEIRGEALRKTNHISRMYDY